MSEQQKIIAINKSEMVGLAARYCAEGYRLVQIGCSTLESAYELNYSFDKDYAFVNLRITAAPNEELPSISVIYPNAFLYENEIHDLFGVTINNISLDYRGTLYRTAIKTPFSTENVQQPEPPKPAAPKPTDASNPPSEAAEGQQAIKE